MDRAKRRFITQKIADKRFRQLYCGYHGTPEAWFHNRYDEKERNRAKGQCRDRRNSWSCRCDYCFGKRFLNQSIADQNFYDQLQEIETNFPSPNILDSSSVGPYDFDHEKWWCCVCPWRSGLWRNGFHHLKSNHND